MEDAIANAKKAELDRELETAGPNIGIAFGIELFEAFHNRRWFTLERFPGWGVVASFGDIVPAYKQSHYVFVSWALRATDFRVGKDV
jgi:hypothetical protein